jgi:hypothetical protein
LSANEKKTDPEAPTEIFWQGLKRRADATGKIVCLFGYVSDVTQDDKLFADRMILIRTEDQEARRLRNAKQYYVTGKRVADVARPQMFKFLEEWNRVSIEEPE